MKKKVLFYIFFFILVALVIVFRYAIVQSTKVLDDQSSRKLVVTSFYPLYFFTQEIGKELVDVVNLTPSGVEPHDYEPNTQDISDISSSNLLVINGAGLEPWVSKLSSDLTAAHTQIVEAGEGLATRKIQEEGKTIQDPHVWLDPVLAQQEVAKIAHALIAIDPKNTAVYEANSFKLQERLKALDVEFQKSLSRCQQRKIVTSHAAFGYVAARYNLEQVAISGLSPEEEPSPKKLIEVTNFVRKEGITHIFFETLISSRLAETIAKEVGVQTIVFNPIEGLTKKEEQIGMDYFSIQKENIENLKIALACG